MTYPSGTQIGPYEIVSLRGVGGMGEVYRARDTRLGRTVALKLLPSGLGADGELRARFEREARTISALSHPHICALFDVGRDNGTDFLVMEYLEGETLAERLERGPLPASLVLRFGAQIAEALQQAHRAGITHRDLKPGNIMITPAGIKLLDFGLAKFIETPKPPMPGRPVTDLSLPPTQLSPLTAEGTIVGTTFYMSPEQLQGKPVDHRTDIFALGVILYEMATGQRPFGGDSIATLITAILAKDPPPMRSLRADVAPALERIVLAALEKEQDERWQTAQDVGRQLRFLSEASLVAEAAAAAPAQSRRLPLALVIAATALAAGVATWLAARHFAPTWTTLGRVSLQIAQPPDLELRRNPELNDFVVSPDGKTLALVAKGPGGTALYVRPLDSFVFNKVEGSDGASSPFWSADGKKLGYVVSAKLWQVNISDTAPPIAICDVSPAGAMATWSGDTILFADARGDRKEIYRVPDSGGTPIKATTLQPEVWSHSWPSFLPDGVHFLYQSFVAGSTERTLMLASLDSPEESTLLRDVSFARMLNRNHMVFVRDGSLVSQRIDIDKGAAIGDPMTIASDVNYFYPAAAADFDASPAGVVIYRTNTSTGRLVLVDRKGAELQVVDDSNLFWDHALSPDGKKAAVAVETRSTGLMNIWIYDLARGIREPFTGEPDIEVSPAWSPDARSIVYSQAEGGIFPHLVRRALNASSSDELTKKGAFEFSASFTPDGHHLYFESDAGQGNKILRLSLDTLQVEPFVDATFPVASPAVSPDGRWLAYTSYASGRPEVYLQQLSGEDPARVRISRIGGTFPKWRADSQELVFVGPDSVVFSAMPDESGWWEDAALQELFVIPGVWHGFDISPDGQSFLISYRSAGAADGLLHVVLGLD